MSLDPSGRALAAGRDPLPSTANVANLVYGLHALAIVVAIAGTATIIGNFIGSVPSIAAVIRSAATRAAPGSNPTTAGRSGRSGGRSAGSSSAGCSP
jgi:hypothetical protein